MNAAKSPITKAHSTAMVVDDDAFSLAVAQRALRNLGFTECWLATDGQEGLRILAELDRSPDLILCDIFMPNKDGFEFLTELGKRRYSGKVVLISGGDSFMMDVAEQLAAADGLHVSAKIIKPLDQNQLAEALGLSRTA